MEGTALQALLCPRCSARLHLSPSSTNEEECALCRGIFKRVGKYAELAVQALSSVDYDTFWIGSRLEFGALAREREIAGRELQPSEMMKVELNREIGKAVASITGKQPKNPGQDALVIVDTAFMSYQLEISPLFLSGRYRKLQRGIPQTKWPCRRCHGKGCGHCNYKGKMYETSVEELIAAPLMRAFQAEEHFFHGMGREDIDAVMLGAGRPFVIELRNPKKRHADLAALQSEINESCGKSVEVQDLRFALRDDVRRMKQAAPSKSYRVLFELEKLLPAEKVREACNSMTGVLLKQRTPKRVLHRRADLVRERRILDCSLVSLLGREATVEIEAESGTYIKEFITGDSGRTVPSLSGALGMQCSVKELDVLDVKETDRDGQSI